MMLKDLMPTSDEGKFGVVVAFCVAIVLCTLIVSLTAYNTAALFSDKPIQTSPTEYKIVPK